MTSTIEKGEKNQVTLTITVDAETFQKAVREAYLKNRANIMIPGFRKGKAPRNIIEQMYGKDVFYGDAAEAIYYDAYEEAVREHELEPVDYPSVNVVSMDENGFVFTATVDVKPEVELGEYKGIEATKVIYEVPESAIDDDINRSRENLARFEEVDREIVEGDEANIDYLGTVDGVPFDGGKAEGYPLTIGSNQFIPGFEEQLIGMKAGEEKDINVTFPEEYHAEDLKGKDAVFHIKVNSVREKQLPDIDDDFVMDISDECDTLEEYRVNVRERLEKSEEERAKNELDNTILTKVVENATVDIPNGMIEREIDTLVRDMENSLYYQGLSMEMFMQYTNSKMEDIRERYRAEAGRRVKSQLVLEAIANAEGIEVTDEDVEKNLQDIAESTQQDIEEIRGKINDEQMQYLKDDIRIQKAIDLIRDAANVTEEKKSRDEITEEAEEADPELEAAGDEEKEAAGEE